MRLLLTKLVLIKITLISLFTFSSVVFAQEDRIRADGGQSTRSDDDNREKQDKKSAVRTTQRINALKNNIGTINPLFVGLESSSNFQSFCNFYETDIKPKLVAPKYIQFAAVDEFALGYFLFTNHAEIRSAFPDELEFFLKRAEVHSGGLKTYTEILVVSKITDKATAKKWVKDAEKTLFSEK